ncbi:hypothetical protein PRIPAC_88013 [Pristionchus pacificus]|uniref:Uncharacterized protein n=1 Tax=Pristionchus pacificus TaxID=54126 RepID=A0A2A6B6J8_PRIPA|nr:hypothetical protein PRIPAC_88013 [Pristionchus pacificus]|eukprot:PDM61502.1 hypothetical protein PRIPAC_50944 [Pristionchus pacificus]
MIVFVAVALLPLISCTPLHLHLPLVTSTADLRRITDSFYCLRECFGMNTLRVEPTTGERRCMRLVDNQTLWDVNAFATTIEGPRCEVYSTAIGANLDMSVHVETFEINGKTRLSGAYSQCAKKCLGIEDKPAAVCKDGSTEYGLIAYGKGHGLDWAAIYGEKCERVLTLITTYQEGIPILISDKGVGLELTVVDGKMHAVQRVWTMDEEEEEESTESSEEVVEEDDEVLEEGSTTEATEDDDDEKMKEESSTDSSEETEEDKDDDDEEERNDDHLGYAEHLAQWLECPMKCFTQGESEGLALKPLAMKYRRSSDGGNWWYDRFTFAFNSQSPILLTLIEHDANTRIRLGEEREAKGETSFEDFDEDLATCLSACYGHTQEYKEFVQDCSESTLIPAWSILEYSDDERDDHSLPYFYATVAIPQMGRGCHSLSTFIFSHTEASIHIDYARDEEEIFSIENRRAISRVIKTTNTSLMN